MDAIPKVPVTHLCRERSLIRMVQEGFWQIDDQGRIWKIAARRGNRKPGRAEHRLPLGYLQVRAMLDGRRIHGLAHRLVWQHFFGDIPSGEVINHKSGIKDDNRPENLETTTLSGNIKHAYAIRLKDQRGEMNPACRLSDLDVMSIRSLRDLGESLTNIAEYYGISYQHVSKIIRGERRN